MRKILVVIAVLVGLVGTTNVVAREIKLTNALVKDISQAYGFYLAQDYSLTQISEKYPSLSMSALIAKKQFLATFKSSIDGMDAIMMKHAKNRWQKIKNQTTGQLPRYSSIDRTSKEQACQFITTVQQRAQGDIEPPIIGTLLLFKSGYNEHPEREFLDGFRYTYTTDGSDKAKGVAFSIEAPKSWVAKEGIRPNVVQKFTSENGRGVEGFLVLIKEIPTLSGEKVTKKDVSELLNSDDIKLFLPKDATIVDYGELTLERLPGFWLSYKMDTSRARSTISMVVIVYQVFYKNMLIQIQGNVLVSANGETWNPEGLTKCEKLFDQVANSFVLTGRYQSDSTKKGAESKLETSEAILSQKDKIDLNKFLLSKKNANSQKIAPVIAISTEQPAEGGTESDLNMETLKNIETWQVTSCKKWTDQLFANLGYDPAQLDSNYESKSQYVIIEGKKIAEIRVRFSSKDGKKTIRAVRLFGFSDNDTMLTVGCIRQSNHDIPVYCGVCGAKIEEVFGITLPGNAEYNKYLQTKKGQ